MTSWGRAFLNLASSAFDINTATLSGAIDIIVVEQEDGSLVSSPFHVRFGKFQVLKSREKRVAIKVNGEKVDLKMKLGTAGEAFFVVPFDGHVSRELATSPITSPRSMSPDTQSPEPSRKAQSALGSPFSLDGPDLPKPLAPEKTGEGEEEGKVSAAPGTPEVNGKHVPDRTAAVGKSLLKDTHAGPAGVRKKVSYDDSVLNTRSGFKGGRDASSSVESGTSAYEDAEEAPQGPSQTNLATSAGSSQPATVVPSLDPDEEFVKWNWGALPVIKKSQSKPEGLAALAARSTSHNLAKKRLSLFEEDGEGSSEGPNSVYGSIFKPDAGGEVEAGAGDTSGLGAAAGGSPASRAKEKKEDKATPTEVPTSPEGTLGTRPRGDSSASLPEDADQDSRYFSADFLATPLEDSGMELSLCWDAFKKLNRDSSDMRELNEAFDAGRLTFESMFEGGKNILDDPNLVIKINDRYYPWKNAGPAILSLLVFRRPPSDKVMDHLLYGDKKKKSIWRSWLWRGGDDNQPQVNLAGNITSPPSVMEQRKQLKVDGDPTPRSDKYAAEEDGPEGILSPGSPRSDDDGAEDGFYKSLRPNADQLSALNLTYGANTVEFSVSSRIQGVRTVSSTIYLWKHTTKVVISDVDGTITRSDVLGHLMPIVGKDWSHAGVTGLYSSIRRNGYEFIYLTSRAIGQADLTRSYLHSVQQGEERLPQGPVVMSPDRLFTSFTREVIRRNPQSFKIACLKDLQSLWPDGANPFVAGFGNRETDAMSYRAVGVPESKILLINPQGEIRHHNISYRKSYGELHVLCDVMFPSVKHEKDGQPAPTEDFNDFNYWRMSTPGFVDILDELEDGEFAVDSRGGQDDQGDMQSGDEEYLEADGEEVEDEDDILDDSMKV